MGWLKQEARRFFNTCRWSLDGWRAAWASEKTLRQWTLANAASAALTFAVGMTRGEQALIFGLGGLVLAAMAAGLAWIWVLFG